MNPNILEEIKNKHLRSAADQVRALFGEVQEIYSQIESIQNELDLKVDLRSKKLLEGTVTYSTIGTGNVSASGFNVTGTNTQFTKECAISDQIKIGTEAKTIIAIVDDTHLTIDNVSPATGFTNTYTDQIYTFIRPATREQLVGEFEFGQTNGTIFNGAINQGSVLTYAGRMINPLDVVNVQFVQKSVGPAMTRAINSIKRDGDFVGPATVKTGTQTFFNYTFQNCTFDYKNTNVTFDQYSEVQYSGPFDKDTDIVNKGSLRDFLSSANPWPIILFFNGSGAAYPSEDYNSTNPYHPPVPIVSSRTRGDYSQYFEIVSDHPITLNILKDCYLDVAGSWTFQGHDNDAGGNSDGSIYNFLGMKRGSDVIDTPFIVGEGNPTLKYSSLNFSWSNGTVTHPIMITYINSLPVKAGDLITLDSVSVLTRWISVFYDIKWTVKVYLNTTDVSS